MKKTLLILSITLLGTLLGFNVMGQVNTANQGLLLGMPELNLLSSISTTVNLQLTTTVAGEKVLASISDESARVKISSVVAGILTRTISARVTTGAVPAGTTLKLLPESANTSFGGGGGTLSGTDVVLTSTADANIITGITSCYSGVAADDGYKLKYTWGLDNVVDSYANIRATAAGTAITVTLTLSAGI